MTQQHVYFMDSAIRLSLKAKGRTSPNPLVGAVVVKNNQIVGKGFHRQAGEDHAEVVALRQAGKNAKGATLYLTLEPCTHYGRTPPCIDRVIQSKVKEVFIAMIDPNPLNNGKGVAALREHGIKVNLGLLEERVKGINAFFIKYITRKLPLVTVKVAQSLDGKIATKDGDSKWITSDVSRGLAHRLRCDFDAVMVGVNTVLRDNPSLSAWFSKRHPNKIIIDSQLSTPAKAQIFNTPGKVIIVTLPSASGQETENRRMITQKAQVLEVKEKSGQIDLRDLLKKLARMEIANILVEGGGTLIGSLFDEGLVDRVLMFMSPKIIGGKESISSVMGKGVTRVEKAVRISGIKLKRIGEDFLFEGYVQRNR